MNFLGNQTLQSRTIQTQKHYNLEQYKLIILLPILVIFFFFSKLFLSLNLKIGTPWPDFHASQLAVHHCSPLFCLFATCNSSFPTVQNRNSMAKLFFLFTPWPTFLSLLFQALCRLTPINCDRRLPLPSRLNLHQQFTLSLSLSLSQTVWPIWPKPNLADFQSGGFNWLSGSSFGFVVKLISMVVGRRGVRQWLWVSELKWGSEGEKGLREAWVAAEEIRDLRLDNSYIYGVFL